MNHKELSASNPSPNSREDDDKKAEETGGAAEISRAVAEARAASTEARRERAEQERTVAEGSRQIAELDRRAAEEQVRSAEELRQAAKEIHGATKNLRAAMEEAKEVLEEAKRPQREKDGADFDRTPKYEVGEGKLFQLQMAQMSGYLAARYVGTAAPGEGSRQFESIAEHCKLTNNDKLLIDITGYKVINPYLADKFIVGERLGIFARYGIRVAFVCGPERIELSKFAGLLAQNRGVKVEVFMDLQAAEEWLLE